MTYIHKKTSIHQKKENENFNIFKTYMIFIRLIYLTYNLLWKIIKRQTRLLSEVIITIPIQSYRVLKKKVIL